MANIFTNRLLSTLGNKTSYKKIPKKEIQSISIPQTCDVIKNPPSPMALRLTSNLLYGVALIYRQKTNFLNNDTSLIKTKIQRDLFSQNGGLKGKDILIKTPSYIIKPVDLTRSIQSGRITANNNQILLKDDPLFCMDAGLLPSLEELDFLQSVDPTGIRITSSNKRKLQIRKADLENNTVSVVMSSITDDSAEDGDVFTRRVLLDQDDILDTENPEFAFNEQGMLLSLHEETTINPGVSNDHPQENDDNGLDFDFDFDVDIEGVDQPQQADRDRELGQILEEIDPHGNESKNDGHVPVVAVEQSRKRRRIKSTLTKLVMDDSISLQTNDLRGFRDTYIEKMESQRKAKSTSEIVTVQNLLDEVSSFLPTFHTSIPLNDFSEERRGRAIERASEDEDFVDGLLKKLRSSSGSIEVRRNASSSGRHSTRASMSSIHLPLEGDVASDIWRDQPTRGSDGKVDDNEFGFDFDFEFDEERVEQQSSKRRSSSVQRFPTLEENEEDDCRGGKREAINKFEVDKKTRKFLTFIEGRFEEDSIVDDETMKFDQLMQYQQDRSIIVKSFYEILQLTTLNTIEIVKEVEAKNKFDSLSANDFSIRLV